MMDLLQLQLDYEAGVITDTELAARYRMTVEQLAFHAKQKGWRRRTPNLPSTLVLSTIDPEEMVEEIWEGEDPANAKRVFTEDELDYRAQLTASHMVRTRAADIHKMQQHVMQHLDRVNDDAAYMPDIQPGQEVAIKEMAARALIRSKFLETVQRGVTAYRQLCEEEDKLYRIHKEEESKTDGSSIDANQVLMDVQARLTQMASDRSAYTNFEGDVYNAILENDKKAKEIVVKK